jgi:hypothetical protein
MIRFTCDCGKLLQARDEQAGRAVACPACGRRQTVPDASAVQPERSPAATGVRQGRESAAAGDEAAPAAGPAVTSGKAVVSLVLGVLSFCTLLLAGLPAALLGFLALNDIKKGRGRVKGKGLAITGLVLGLVNTLLTCACVPLSILLWPAVQNVTETSARIQSQNNLKQISLAMLNYNDVNGCFPPAALLTSDMPGIPGHPNDPRAKPGLSWRVAILPYIEEGQLYQQFRLNEPWDSPHNKALLPRIPKTYLLPGESGGPNGLTKYQVFVGPQTIFEEGQRIRITQVLDGTTNTLLVVEAANGVPWTKPEDLRFNPNGPLPPLGGRFRKGFTAVFADGHTALIPRDTPEQTLKALITRNGGEIVPPF